MYFIKHKKIHKCPVPSSCREKYTGEKKYAIKPKGYEKCGNCFKPQR